MSRPKFTRAVARVAVACGIAATVAVSAAASAQAATNVTIGVISSQTGPFSPCGVEQLNGVKLWVNRFNLEQHKYHISLDTADDQSTASGAVSAMQSVLSNQSVVGVIGLCNTTIADATVPLANSDGRPVVYFDATELPGRGTNEFSLAPPETGLYRFAAKYVFKAKHAKTTALITLDATNLDQARPGIITAAHLMHVKVLSNQSLGTTVTNFQSEVINAMHGKPDVVVVLASPATTGSIVKDFRQNGYKGTILASESADQSATHAAAGASEAGLYVPTNWDASLASKSVLSKSYINAYRRAYSGQPLPDVYGAAAWDAANVMTTAIARVGTSKQALVKAIAHGSFAGVEGTHLEFGAQGIANLSNALVQFNAKGVAKAVTIG